MDGTVYIDTKNPGIAIHDVMSGRDRSYVFTVIFLWANTERVLNELSGYFLFG